MERMAPGISIRVENTLENNDSELAVNLAFNKIEDFEPAQIVNQVPALKELMDTRNKLRDLLTKSDRSDELEAILEKTLQNSEALISLANELGVATEQTSTEGE